MVIQSVVPEGTARGRRAGASHSPVQTTRIAAWAGMVGPVLFTAAYMAQEVLRRGEYDPVAEPVSALEAGPNGWVQRVNFVVFGVLTLVFATGLHRGVRGTRADVAGPAVLGLSGIGLLLAAAFPLREDAGGVTYDPGGHIVAGVIFFLGSAVGLAVLSRRLARDPRWRGLAVYTLMSGLLALAAFIAMAALVMPDGAPLHEWAGAGQRAVILVLIFPCRTVLSLRLLRAAHPE